MASRSGGPAVLVPRSPKIGPGTDGLGIWPPLVVFRAGVACGWPLVVFARRWTGSRRGHSSICPPPPPALPWPWPWPCGAGQPCEHANAIAQSGPRFPMGPRGIWGAAIVVTPPRIGVSLRLAALPPCRRRLASSRGIPTQGRTWASSRRAQLSRTDRSSMKRHSGG